MLKKICFSCQINLTIGERPYKKNIESLNLTQEENLSWLLTWKIMYYIIIKLMYIVHIAMIPRMPISFND